MTQEAACDLRINEASCAAHYHSMSCSLAQFFIASKKLRVNMNFEGNGFKGWLGDLMKSNTRWLCTQFQRSQWEQCWCRLAPLGWGSPAPETAKRMSSSSSAFWSTTQICFHGENLIRLFEAIGLDTNFLANELPSLGCLVASNGILRVGPLIICYYG